MKFRDELQKIPAGFRALILKGRLSASLVEVIIRLTFVYQRTKLERAPSGLIIDLPYSTQPVFRTFQEACPALDATGPSKEKLTTMAILLYCGIGFDSAPISSNGGLAARAELLKMYKLYEWEPQLSEEKELLFWIWIVTICSWQKASGRGLLPPGIELLRNLWQGSGNLKEWKDAEAILQKFFWNQRLSELCIVEFERCKPR